MDPNACYERWRNAVARGDQGEAHDALTDLRTWLASGGFQPSWRSEYDRNFVCGTIAQRKDSIK